MTTVSVDLPSLLLMIDNQWRAGGGQEWLEVINPATERPVGRLAVAAKSDLDEALASAATGRSRQAAVVPAITAISTSRRR